MPPVRPARPRFRLGLRITPAVMWMIVVSLAAFLFFAFSADAARGQIAKWLILTPGSLLDGHVWKLVTTAVFTLEPLAFVLDLVVLFLFMPFLEREWGTRGFLRFLAIVTLAANVVAAGVGLLLGGLWTRAPIAGLSPFIFGALIGYGVAFGNRLIQFFGVIPMKGRTMAIGIAVVVLAAAIFNGHWVEGAANVGAMVAAFLLTSDRITPKLWLLRWRRARLRKRYSVIDGGASNKKWIN